MTVSDVYDWVRQTLSKAPKPFLLGINGPQGAGKSTLARLIVEDIAGRGLKAISVSIDDFYLTRAEQVNLAESYPDNPYLQQRGYPGTHDIELGRRVLRSLKAAGPAEAIHIPRYDKSAFGGKGDRAPKSEWTEVRGPLDLIILEGWMLGFAPVEESALPNAHFQIINRLLALYETWHGLLDGFIQLKPDHYENVLTWRVEAEEKMKASGKPGMSREEVTGYSQLFLPAYQTYLAGLTWNPPAVARSLVVPIGLDRLPLT